MSIGKILLLPVPLSSKSSSVYCRLDSLGNAFPWGRVASRYLRHAIGAFVALTFTGPTLNIKKHWLRADGFEKLLSWTTVCVPQLSVNKCKFSRTFWTHGLWSEAETTYHISELELLAVEFGLGSLLVDCRGQHIRVVSDNTTAVSYINGIESKFLPSDSITGTIWSWAINRGNWLPAAHIPGTSNVSADDLSRNFKADTEWALSNDVFPGSVVSAGCQILTFSRAGLTTKSPGTLHGSQTPSLPSWMLLLSIGASSQMHMLSHLFASSVDVCRK